MPEDTAVKVSNISKTFILPHEKHNSVKSAFVNFYKKKKGYEKQQVLNNISFEIKKGEFFGIVGRNGSGKSTLLKLLAGIYTPDSGDIQISGKLTPFIELGVGFNPELSGRENVFLNGALLGFSRKEMESMYDEIVEFAELERFMDQKLKNYSSGMQVRLAFSIAIRANTDILVLDEVLAVGDAAFQRKCFEYFKQLKNNKKTVVLVSHDMESVQKFSDRALLVDKGDLVLIGDPSDVGDEYIRQNMEIKPESRKKSAKNGTQDVVIKSVALIDKVTGKEIKSIQSGQTVCIKINYDIKKAINKLNIGVGMNSDYGYVFGYNTQMDKVAVPVSTGSINLEISSFNLLRGAYFLNVVCFGDDEFSPYDLKTKVVSFSVKTEGNAKNYRGTTYFKHGWEYESQ